MRRRPGTSRSCDAAPWCSPASCGCGTPDYGYALLESLNALGIIVDANTLYPLLRRLEKQGLLVSEWNTEEARPRKFYRTSPAGEALADVLTTDWRRIDGALARTHDRRRPMTTLTDRYVWAATRSVPDSAAHRSRARAARAHRRRDRRPGRDGTRARRRRADGPRRARRPGRPRRELRRPAAAAHRSALLPHLVAAHEDAVLGRAADRRRRRRSSPRCCRAPTWARSSAAPIGVGISIAVHLGFWTTLAFAVLERSPGKGADLVVDARPAPAAARAQPARPARRAHRLARVPRHLRRW